MGTYTFQKSNNHFKILGGRRVTWNKLGTAENLITWMTLQPGFVNPCSLCEEWLYDVIGTNILLICRPLECLALMVSCACHDLDHRGTTNSFQTQSGTVLANLYSSEGSVMEVKNIYIYIRFSYVHHCQFHRSWEVCFVDLGRHVSQICCCDSLRIAAVRI
jgi:hypothetical protein